MSGPPILEVRGLYVVFDGFRAIDGLDLTVDEGEVRFLIGPNGAGKTTLIDTITGLTKPAGGTISFSAQPLVGLLEWQIVRLGVGRTFQTASVFEHLTVVENLDLAASFRKPFRSLLRKRRAITEPVALALDEIGLADRASDLAGVLSHGQKQWLEIGMLLVQDPRLLLLDEPVAGMSKEERTRTGELLRKIALSRTVVVVEHDMDFLRRFANRVTVMHEGKVLCEGTVAEVQADTRVQEVYLGRSRDTRNTAEVR
ncbi:MAG: urea ABC transporter ATP-binding protein UrtD [Acidimicrobiales bacterium]